MTKADEYRAKLQTLDDWAPYLLKNSGLPGPRGNLELAAAVAELADISRADKLLATPREKAPENSANVFLVFCGVTSLGKLAAGGNHSLLARIRPYATDDRWRVREAAAIALQYLGDADMPLLLKEAGRWAEGNWYEKRAAAASLAEPRLLKDMAAASSVLQLFDKITADIQGAASPSDESLKVLRQAMGYCWSVAVAAAPAKGRPRFEKWLASASRDVRWIVKENLKKNRLIKVDPNWVQACLHKVDASG